MGALRGSIFNMSVNAELLDERAQKVPHNNDQFLEVVHILGVKPGQAESERDTILMIKDKCLISLQAAMVLGHKFDLNLLMQNA